MAKYNLGEGFAVDVVQGEVFVIAPDKRYFHLDEEESANLLKLLKGDALSKSDDVDATRSFLSGVGAIVSDDPAYILNDDLEESEALLQKPSGITEVTQSNYVRATSGSYGCFYYAGIGVVANRPIMTAAAEKPCTNLAFNYHYVMTSTLASKLDGFYPEYKKPGLITAGITSSVVTATWRDVTGGLESVKGPMYQSLIFRGVSGDSLNIWASDIGCYPAPNTSTQVVPVNSSMVDVILKALSFLKKEIKQICFAMNIFELIDKLMEWGTRDVTEPRQLMRTWIFDRVAATAQEAYIMFDYSAMNPVSFDVECLSFSSEDDIVCCGLRWTSKPVDENANLSKAPFDQLFQVVPLEYDTQVEARSSADDVVAVLDEKIRRYEIVIEALSAEEDGVRFTDPDMAERTRRKIQACLNLRRSVVDGYRNGRRADYYSALIESLAQSKSMEEVEEICSENDI